MYFLSLHLFMFLLLFLFPSPSLSLLWWVLFYQTSLGSLPVSLKYPIKGASFKRTPTTTGHSCRRGGGCMRGGIVPKSWKHFKKERLEVRLCLHFSNLSLRSNAHVDMCRKRWCCLCAYEKGRGRESEPARVLERSKSIGSWAASGLWWILMAKIMASRWTSLSVSLSLCPSHTQTNTQIPTALGLNGIPLLMNANGASGPLGWEERRTWEHRWDYCHVCCRLTTKVQSWTVEPIPYIHVMC